MDTSKKQLTKQSTETKKVMHYEKQRMKAINKIRERMNALGVKNITTCLKATVLHKKLRKNKYQLRKMTMIIDRQRLKMAVTLNPMIRLSMRYYTFMHCEIYSFLLLSIH